MTTRFLSLHDLCLLSMNLRLWGRIHIFLPLEGSPANGKLRGECMLLRRACVKNRTHPYQPSLFSDVKFLHRGFSGGLYGWYFSSSDSLWLLFLFRVGYGDVAGIQVTLSVFQGRLWSQCLSRDSDHRLFPAPHCYHHCFDDVKVVPFRLQLVISRDRLD
ncbi:hypothetical protein BJ165DRAFT_1002946 [Panaeolus papilionaceus]|nr:hypothetical protein BJ165DRAFT_1002946 [Panaeolus papilionaceus]